MQISQGSQKTKLVRNGSLQIVSKKRNVIHLLAIATASGMVWSPIANTRRLKPSSVSIKVRTSITTPILPTSRMVQDSKDVALQQFITIPVASIVGLVLGQPFHRLVLRAVSVPETASWRLCLSISHHLSKGGVEGRWRWLGSGIRRGIWRCWCCRGRALRRIFGGRSCRTWRRATFASDVARVGRNHVGKFSSGVARTAFSTLNTQQKVRYT